MTEDNSILGGVKDFFFEAAGAFIDLKKTENEQDKLDIQKAIIKQNRSLTEPTHDVQANADPTILSGGLDALKNLNQTPVLLAIGGFVALAAFLAVRK